MPSTRHEALVAKIADRYGLKTRGFCRAVRRALDLERCDRVSVQPDAFRIDEGAQEVRCYEIEVTATISPLRIQPYISLFEIIDSESWTLRLFRVHHTEAYRLRVRVEEVDMQRAFHAHTFPHVPYRVWQHAWYGIAGISEGESRRLARTWSNLVSKPVYATLNGKTR